MLHVHVYVHVHICRNAGLSGIQLVRYRTEKTNDAGTGPVRYRTKVTQSGIFLVRYRTKIWNAGMPMSALVSSMLMPSYAQYPAHDIFSAERKI
jgi:hypothetical protein